MNMDDPNGSRRFGKIPPAPRGHQPSQDHDPQASDSAQRQQQTHPRESDGTFPPSYGSQRQGVVTRGFQAINVPRDTGGPSTPATPVKHNESNRVDPRDIPLRSFREIDSEAGIEAVPEEGVLEEVML
jgi:hypothetical protein